MGTNYPGSQDNNTTLPVTTPTEPTDSPSHSGLHENIKAAILALEAAVGYTGSFQFVLVGATAGGDLVGTYPSPTLKTTGPGATGPIGDSSNVPVITIDAEGRVTALASAAVGSGPPSGAASGDLSGSYPGPGVAQVQGIAVTSGNATLLSQMKAPVNRTSSATAAAGEETILSGSTGAQTLTLPAAPASGTPARIVNISSQNWAISANAGDALNFFGGASLTLGPNQGAELYYLASATTWYVMTYSIRNVGGDISGTMPNPSVIKVQGVALLRPTPPSPPS